MKKNRLSIFSLIALFLVFIIVFIVVNIKNKKNVISYIKYTADITVSIKTDNATETLHFTIKDDGENASVVSSMNNNTSYILGKKLYYLSDYTYYIYASNRNYRDFLSLVDEKQYKDKIREEGEYSYYSKVLSAKELNDILASLYFGKKTTSSKVVEIIKKDNKITNFSLSMGDIDGYEQVDIVASFKEMEDSFTVDTSSVTGRNDKFGSLKYNYENTDENIYEIVK